MRLAAVRGECAPVWRGGARFSASIISTREDLLAKDRSPKKEVKKPKKKK
jgi:hypothetical protein